MNPTSNPQPKFPGPRTTKPQAGPRLVKKDRARPLVAQPVRGLVIAPVVADRSPLPQEPTPICASVEQDLRMSFEELTTPHHRSH